MSDRVVLTADRSLPATEVPMWLWTHHRLLEAGMLVEVVVPTATMEPGLVGVVLEGAGFGAVDVTTRRGTVVATARRERSLADTVAVGMSLLCVGLNPSPYAADVGVGFARPGNRFWPAALESGIVTVDRDPLDALRSHGVGMTDLAKRATVRADELTPAEFTHGIDRLDTLCRWLSPRAVCLVGLSGWRAAVDRRAVVGWQDRRLGGCPTFVMHNPSGLNAHVTVSDLADQLRTAAGA